MFITMLDVVLHSHPELKGKEVNGSVFEQERRPMIGGCWNCHATIAAYNMYPSQNGYVMCAGCVDGYAGGFKTVEEFLEWEKKNENSED